jgi:hypothetical protein
VQSFLKREHAESWGSSQYCLPAKAAVVTSTFVHEAGESTSNKSIGEDGADVDDWRQQPL